jgi:competence protein ComEA
LNRRQWILAALVVGVAGFVGWWFGDPPDPPPPIRVAGQTSGAGITVHVAGEVDRPGLVTVAAGARVADAVEAAGGLLASADASTLNLAAPLADGQQVVVRPRGPGPATSVGSGVHLNSASAGELEEIPGVGPVLAARIVDHRTEHGPFATVEDLLDVAGIGEAKLAALRDAVVVP